MSSVSSITSTQEKQPPSNSQRRCDALLEQLTMPLKNPMASLIQNQPAAVVLSPGSKDSLESTKDANVSQQTTTDIKVKFWI